MSKKISFVVKDKDGNAISPELAVRMPTSTEQIEARIMHAKTWGDAVNRGVRSREFIEQYVKENNLVSDEKQEESKEINKKINAGLLKLKQGGKAGLTKKKARDLAFEILDLRGKLSELRNIYGRLDANSAEAIADQVKFDKLVSCCVVFDGDGPNAGTRYFSSYEAMVESKEDPVTAEATYKFAELFYGGSDEEPKDDPEVKFLKENGFADKDGNLTRPEDGHLVDREGRLIKKVGEELKYVDEYGDVIDREGNLVDENGEFIVDSAPFLDDEDDE